MFSIATDENNDIYIDGKGQVAIVDGLQAILQVVKNRIKTLYNELQFNQGEGVPYFETIFGTGDVALWEDFIKKEAVKVNGVIRVDYLRSTVKDNLLTYELRLITDEGVGTIRG